MRAVDSILILLAWGLNPQSGLAQPVPATVPLAEIPRSDALAVHKLFEEQVLAENALAICRRADRLTADKRYAFLLEWVLPGATHPTIRLSGSFFPGSPAPPVSPVRAGLEIAADAPPLMRYLAGAETLAFPAYELVKVARQTGRLDQLRQRVVDVQPLDADQRCSQTALLFVVDVARGDADAMASGFEQLAPQLAASDRSQLSARWRDLLIMWSILPEPVARQLVGDYVFSFYGDIAKYFPDPDFDVLMDYLRGTQGMLAYLGQETAQSKIVVDAMHQGTDWVAYSFTNSYDRGHGRQRAVWAIQPDEIRKIAGHEMDYLAYRIPLRGDFEVECETTTGSSLNVGFMVAGTPIEYIEHTKSIRVGNFRKQFEDIPIRPPLPWNNQQVQHRVVVRGGFLTHSINGRAVLQKELPPQFDPWIAVRSWRRSHGGFRNLKITGNPTIPDQIEMISGPTADGWAPYHEERFGIDAAAWEVVQDPSGELVIHGRRRDVIDSKTVQSLLRYHRPIEEDGTIEYEFLYEPGRTCVHPALDRLAFILAPDGVRIHWVTDCVRDHTELHPTNETVEVENRRGPKQLPLVAGDWNKVRLTFEGDHVQLSLNGELIYERTLEPENRRTFGFFFWSDQTDAQVRNAIWRGDWPKELPDSVRP